MKRLVAVVAVVVVGVIVGEAFRGISPSDMVRVGRAAVLARMGRKTVEARMDEIERRHPGLADSANAICGGLQIVVFKRERFVELHAKGWTKPRVYAMQGFSGVLGPKLKEGDGQIPEGVYGVEYLNPNSLFHLSLKVSYPNAFDRVRAREDGRTNLGGDIMIHGGSATVGCIPIGDDGVEEVFYFVGRAGCENVKVVIAPYDMRRGRVPELEALGIPWYPELCAVIYGELSLL